MSAKVFLVIGLVCAACVSLFAAAGAAPAAADPKHRIVFEVTGDGEELWTAVLNNVENVRMAFGPENTEIEVVAHGKGLGLVMGSNKGQQERMKTLSDSGVVFAACQNTMTRKNITKDQLLPFALVVDAGVAEVVRKQEQGWSYIKSGI